MWGNNWLIAESTREVILSIEVLVEKYYDVQKYIFLCFFDYEKVFDRVQHDKLIEALQSLNTDGTDFYCIKNNIRYANDCTLFAWKIYSYYSTK